MNNLNQNLNKLSNIIQDLLLEKHDIENRMLILQSISDMMFFKDSGEFKVTGKSILDISDILNICHIEHEIKDDTLIITWGNPEDEEIDKEWVSKLP